MGKKKPKSPAQILAMRAAERRRNMERAGEARALERSTAKDPSSWGVSPDALILSSKPDQPVSVVPFRPGGGRHTKRLSGLDWLWSKDRLSEQQVVAGLKYGDDYRLATEHHVKIARYEDGISGGGSGDPQKARDDAWESLTKARKVGLLGHKEMIRLCDEVAGEGKRVRAAADSDDDLAQKLEAKLGVALDLLVQFYGIVSR